MGTGEAFFSLGIVEDADPFFAEVLDDPHRHIYNGEAITMIRLFKLKANLFRN